MCVSLACTIICSAANFLAGRRLSLVFWVLITVVLEQFSALKEKKKRKHFVTSNSLSANTFFVVDVSVRSLESSVRTIVQ